MDTLKSTLENFAKADFHMGEGSAAPQRESTVARLKEQLQLQRKKNTQVLWLCCLTTIVVFGVAVGYLIRGVALPDSTKVVYGSGGILAIITPVVTVAHKNWRDNTTIDFLLAMADDVDNGTLKSIISTLLEKLYR